LWLGEENTQAWQCNWVTARLGFPVRSSSAA
jgi:hypothetical protein